MLIKVTNKCSMGCSHCMEDSTVQGEHMQETTFRKALDFARQAEAKAWQMGIPPMILLSGGECTEHPQIVEFVKIVFEQKMIPLLLTNGMWLNTDLREALLRPEWSQMQVQITNDPEFYPQKPPVIDHAQLHYVGKLTHLLPLGRITRKKNQASIPSRKAPTSFNLRSITRSTRSFQDALAIIRARAAVGYSGHCSPSISENGDVMAGESRNCYKVGTVDSSMSDITNALIGMQCNKCGLVKNLTMEQKRAIGETNLFGHDER